MKKRLLALIITTVMILSVIAGCSSAPTASNESQASVSGEATGRKTLTLYDSEWVGN